MKDNQIQINGRNIGIGHPTYFIADIAANHDGDIERAKELIYLCAKAGANAAKFQNFSADTIVSDYGFKNMDSKVSHQSKWSKSVYEIYDDASLPVQWTKELKETCNNAGIDYLTAPYDISIVNELSKYVCAWKLGSGDITWHENIAILAQDGKPLLIATGASNMSDVEMAMEVANRYTNDIVLMQCNTNYTASLENFKFIALNVLKSYKKKFPNVVLGLSDHTPGHSTVLGAVTLGARVIEKHFTDNVKRDGPDHKFSMDFDSWSAMVHATRELELALGPEKKEIMGNELETVIVQRRGIRAKHHISIGGVIKKKDIEVLRPCSHDCLPPYMIKDIIGRVSTRDIEEGDCIKLADLE